jgi:hypothetical protein
MVSQGLIQVIERHGMRQERLGQLNGRDMDDQPAGAKNVAAFRVLLMNPACHRGHSYKAIPRGFGRHCPGLTQRDSNNVRCVRLKNDCAAFPLKNQPGALCLEYCAAECCEHDRDQHFTAIPNGSHLTSLLLVAAKNRTLPNRPDRETLPAIK